MKLHHYKPDEKTINFGDELNTSIWRHYLPNIFNGSDASVFFGIGTILRAAKKHYPNSKILIFGSGAHSNEQTMEKNFDVKFVRGPLTAKALGLPENKAITDPAIVTPLVFPLPLKEKKFSFSYMPHYSVANTKYEAICKKLGIQYIDPRDPVTKVLAQINATDVLLSEAMHGAIVADAYRIPWVPVHSYKSFNEFKWNDWAASLKIKIAFNKIPRLYESDKGIKWMAKKIVTALKLRVIMKKTPYLSEEDIFRKAQSDILKQVEAFKRE
jgi:succinoglycan biosynthesis protein ExoV|tara:strand:+ start:28962 stop:29771 length:810 start_codon:yes stop_codon:yes gene_type:complete